MTRLWTPGNGAPHVASASGESVRVLACATCETIEVVDPYDGPPARAKELDKALNAALEKHRTGVERIPHVGQMFRIAAENWNNLGARTQILQQIVAKFDPNAETGLGAEAYAMKDNYQADAMACWAKHQRTPDCSDYKSDQMLLTPDTQAERKELGMDPFDKDDPGTQVHLCVYCPVHSLVQQAARKRAGLYDK